MKSGNTKFSSSFAGYIINDIQQKLPSLLMSLAVAGKRSQALSTENAKVNPIAIAIAIFRTKSLRTKFLMIS